MVRKIIDWSLDNSFLVLIVTLALAIGGSYSFTHVNIEAYPDPAPPSSRSSPRTPEPRRKKSSAK